MRFEPTRRDDRVVVEEHDVLAARQLGAAIAGADEAQVRGVALEPHAGHGRQRRGHRLGRRVVDDDHLDHVVRRMRVQALEAGVREERLAVDRDHDRHPRRGRTVERERRNLLLDPEPRGRRGLEALFRLHLGAHALRQRPGALVAQDRNGHRRQLRQPEDSRSPRAKARARHLDLVAGRTQRLRHPPRLRVLELVDAMARRGQRRIEMRRVQLHLLGLHCIWPACICISDI